MDDKRLMKFEKNIEKLATDLEKTKICEYVNIMNDSKRLLYINFIAGLARGLGTAIGLTILAAVFFYMLKSTVDLPLIGKYIAQLIKIIENYK
ncbi:DUF5665 domain-containing protein [Inediibacterium massiliense]|uniref:DUF5665 domain-containing protein n=1 Tax=Inediibacterium massiliense TaxID=1658111 RepID=UPI000DA5F677|nr:DUF5665 domain-containing protein [Inediibacterium massiliense]